MHAVLLQGRNGQMQVQCNAVQVRRRSVTMRARRQARCANLRRMTLRASSTTARYRYSDPVRMPNSRNLCVRANSSGQAMLNNIKHAAHRQVQVQRPRQDAEQQEPARVSGTQP